MLEELALFDVALLAVESVRHQRTGTAEVLVAGRTRAPEPAPREVNLDEVLSHQRERVEAERLVVKAGADRAKVPITTVYFE